MQNKHIITNSSSIAHIDWNDKNNTLEICFTSGHTYHYPNCDKKHFAGLKEADSAGKYFQSNIRNQYNGHKVHK